MGVEYNQLGEVCESRKKAKGEEICMGWDNSFRHSVFVHEEQVERKKESLELVHPWRENSRASRVLEHIWSWKLKSQVVQA
jgi:hypothetical protein